MEKREFMQISFSFGYFLFAIWEFQVLELGVNFLVTFILAIFTIFISIFFFIKTNEINISIKESLVGIEKDVKTMQNGDIVRSVEISQNVKEMFPKAKKIVKFKKNKPFKKL